MNYETKSDQNNYKPVFSTTEETTEIIKEKAKYTKFIYSEEEERELALMLKARDMRDLLWNLKYGIADLMNGKNASSTCGTARHTYVKNDNGHSDVVERPTQDILEDLYAYISETLDDRGILLDE